MTPITARKKMSITSAANRRPSTSVGSRGGAYGWDISRLSLNRPGNCSTRCTPEVLVVAARRRPALTLVLRPGRAAPVRVLGGRGHLQERDLADLHLGVDRDRKVRDVRQLEREVAVPSRVDEPGRRVDEQAQPPQRALAFQPRDQIVGERDALERGAEHEL